MSDRDFVKDITWHLLTFRKSPRSPNHEDELLSSLYRHRQSSLELICKNSLTSITNAKKQQCLRVVLKPLIKRANNRIGERWQPWGTPEVMFVTAERQSKMFTHCFLIDKYDLNQDRSGSPKLVLWRTSLRIAWSIWSKAL